MKDGSADICRFLNLQCHHDRIDFPYHWAGRYSNLKKIFQNGYKPKTKMKLEQMLEHLGLEFEGRLHRLDFESIYSMNIILRVVQRGVRTENLDVRFSVM